MCGNPPNADFTHVIFYIDVMKKRKRNKEILCYHHHGGGTHTFLQQAYVKYLTNILFVRKHKIWDKHKRMSEKSTPIHAYSR
jgi:hypothetical protein